MPVRIERQDQGSPERLALRHVRPGQDPYLLRDHSSGAALLIAVVCSKDGSMGQVYHIPSEQLGDSEDTDRLPDGLLTGDNLHTIIRPGKGYERQILRPGEDQAVRFIFKYF